MKISIFEQVKPLPKSKQEKIEESKKASHCRVISAETDDALVQAVCTYAWSPFVFQGNKRLANNFISTDFLVYDIDKDMTIDKAAEIVEREKLCALILPSTSHSPENHRFRIILPLARTITSAEVYQETWLTGAEIFGVVDEQCKDLARYFFSCRSDDGFWIEGRFFEPILPVEKAPAVYTGESTLITVTEDLSQLVEEIYGEKREKIPEAVEFFLKNAPSGIPGGWTNAISACTFSLTLSGVEEDVIWEVLEKLAPEGKLDKSDQYQIKRAIRDGKAAV